MLSTTKDQKGNTTTSIYDVWGKNTKTTNPDGSYKEISYNWVSSPSGALYSETTNISNAPNKVTYYNANGLIIREGNQRYNGSFLYVDNVYDSKERLQKESLPFTGSSPTAWNTVTKRTHTTLPEM